MNWLKELLEKAVIEDGKLDVDSIMKDVNTEFPKHAIPKETYNHLAKEKKQLDLDIQAKDSELEELKKIDVDALKQEAETYKLKNLKTSIAVEAGIPLELAGRLSGETEEEIKADAENFADFVNKKPTLPLKPTEPPKVDKEDQAYASLADNLT